MSDWIKTGQPVPLWYETVVEFSDGADTIIEPWNGKEFAVRAANDWKEIAALDRAAGKDYTVTVTVVPKYTPRPR